MFTTKNLLILIGKQSIVAFVSIIVALVAVSFLAREIDRVSGAVVQNRQLAEKLAKRTELFSVLSHDVSLVGSNGAAIEHAFLSTENILEFVSILESIALKNNATQSFHFDTPLASDTPSPFPISTVGYQNTIALNIFSFINYIKDFERLPYFTKITSLSFGSQDSSGWRGAGSATFRAVLYTKTNQ